MSRPAAGIPELDRKGLRHFGLLMSGIVATLFGILLPFVFGRGWPLWPWVLATAFALPALLAPQGLRPVYRAWMRIGLLLNRIMTPLIMGILFFLVFTPVALLMKLIRRDALRREIDPSADSYRIVTRGQSPSDMERPF